MRKNILVFFSGWSFTDTFIEHYLHQACKESGYELICIDPLSYLTIRDGESYLKYEDIKSVLETKGSNSAIASLKFCGWSLGGIAAVKYYLHFKDSISSLTLINTSSDFLCGDRQREVSFDKLYSGIESGNSKILLKFYLGLLNETALWTDAIQPSIDELVEQSRRYTTNELLRGLQFLKKGISPAELKEVSLPMTIITAKYDQLIPPSHSELIKNSIPHAELHYIESYSHLLPLQNPRICITKM